MASGTPPTVPSTVATDRRDTLLRDTKPTTAREELLLLISVSAQRTRSSYKNLTWMKQEESKSKRRATCNTVF